MDRKGLEIAWRELNGFRRSQPKAADLERFARRLGRVRTDRGKEPTYVSRQFTQLRPLSIPNHKGRDLATGTKNSILSQLEDDLMAWEEFLEQA